MSGPYDSLLIDIGNSRIKYALCNGSQASLEVHSCESFEHLMQPICAVKQVFLASVRDKSKFLAIEQFCDSQKVGFTTVQTQPEAFGIQCAYQQFDNLGVDRWLTVLAARVHTQLPVAILDVGTAITCDFVLDNRHLGGWIAPGFSVMKEAIATRADRVFADQTRPTVLISGTSTEKCVNMGCLASIQGTLFMAQQQMNQYGVDYKIFVCGGDQDLLQFDDDDRIERRPNLVLEGLQRFV